MHILIVEQGAVLRRVYRTYLTRAQYHVSEASDGRAVWETLHYQRIPLLITTWPMPNIDGVEVLHNIRNTVIPAYTYVILLVQPGSDTDLLRGMQAGADDYMVKPVSLKGLRRRVILGGRIMKLESRVRQMQEQQQYLTTRDLLTGLMNRQALYEYAITELERYRALGRPFSLVLAHLDALKELNERHGDHVGNQALRLAADAITHTVRQYDGVGRWSGAQMLLLLPDTTINTAHTVAERIRTRITATNMLLPNSQSHPLRVSVGISNSSATAITPLAALIRQATEALACARTKGANAIVRYGEE